jgi:acetyl-CoA acetyltransferase
VRAVLAHSKLDHAKVQTVVMGNVVQAGNKMNPARQAGIHGGLPVKVPAMTVNRVCGSGAQAIASAAQEVILGYIDCALAGGMENMDRAPYLMGSGRWGYRMGDSQIYDSMLRDGLNDAFSDQHSGWHTEDLVKSSQITREDQDRWAERSRRRRLRASLRTRSHRSSCANGTSRDSLTKTSTTARTPRSRALPSCGRPSARTAPSPPAMRLASIAARRR